MPSQTTAPSEPRRPVQRPTRTKIIATIGPASESEEMIAKLIDAGVGIFRFNFSHGKFDEHARRLQSVRKVSKRLGRVIACLGDLSGPKIRTTQSPEGGVMLEAGADVLLRAGVEEAFMEDGVPVLGTTLEDMIDEVEPGQRVLINDGAIRMLAVGAEAEPRQLRCRVLVGGPVTSKKGINLPETELSTPAITDYDWECVEWAVAHGIDLLALSFVRRPEELLELKQRLAGLCSVDRSSSDESGSQILVVAKVEKPQAVRRIDEIAAASDAVMVARGDLGVEMDLAEAPPTQKRILAACHEWGKPAIVATQMLESMIEAGSPTRAEATDVANAIFDGADCVMLSGETAVGKRPALVVETMRRICTVAEGASHEFGAKFSAPKALVESRYRTAALAHGAYHIARDLDAKLIVCWSQNGGTARYLSNHPFSAPVIAYTSNERATRRMALLSGVTPLLAAPPESGRLSAWCAQIDEDLLARGWVSPGDALVLVAGLPLGEVRATNTVTSHYVGRSDRSRPLE
ncbi:MAG: pyruvate kinase [Planctomycetota bacterium]